MRAGALVCVGMDGSLVGKEVLVPAARLEIDGRTDPVPFIVTRFHQRDAECQPYYDVSSEVLKDLDAEYKPTAWRACDLLKFPSRSPSALSGAQLNVSLKNDMSRAQLAHRGVELERELARARELEPESASAGCTW